MGEQGWTAFGAFKHFLGDVTFPSNGVRCGVANVDGRGITRWPTEFTLSQAPSVDSQGNYNSAR